jgi:hypothetical protein
MFERPAESSDGGRDRGVAAVESQKRSGYNASFGCAMKDRLLRSLARLSSEEYQNAFIVHGTRDEYVLPEDLVEDVASLCALAQREEQRGEFLPDELEALDRMLSDIRTRCRRVFAAAMPATASSLVHDNEEWRSLRTEAQSCLNTFRARAEDFVVDEIKQKRGAGSMGQ